MIQFIIGNQFDEYLALFKSSSDSTALAWSPFPGHALRFTKFELSKMRKRLDRCELARKYSLCSFQIEETKDQYLVFLPDDF